MHKLENIQQQSKSDPVEFALLTSVAVKLVIDNHIIYWTLICKHTNLSVRQI